MTGAHGLAARRSRADANAPWGVAARLVGIGTPPVDEAGGVLVPSALGETAVWVSTESLPATRLRAIEDTGPLYLGSGAGGCQ